MNGNKLKGKIAEKGLSQRFLAEQLGITKNTFNFKINGKSLFNTEEIKIMCSLLGIEDDSEKAEIFLS